MNHERDLGAGTGKAECGRFVIGPELDVVEVEGDEEGGCFFEIYGWEIDKEGRGVGDTGFGGHGDRLDSGPSGKLSELLKDAVCEFN